MPIAKGWYHLPPRDEITSGAESDDIDPRQGHHGDMATEPIIEVQGLRKAYGAATVVDDVSFTVQPGEVFGIVGSNGAGKTTTVECLQGLRRPDAGMMRICGLDPLVDTRELGALVGSQLQDSALPDRLRVGEALDLFATERAAPLDEVLHTWGLVDQRRTAFANLSGGQQQKLFVALALLNRPQVVFLDELTQGLDPAARRVVWDLITELRAGGTTVVLVTHFMDEAQALCDRIGIMKRGRLVGVGSPDELISDFGHALQMSFTPPPDLDMSAVARLPGVDEAATIGGRLELKGSNDLIVHVGAALAVCMSTPTDIQVGQPSLEDVLVPILTMEEASA